MNQLFIKISNVVALIIFHSNSKIYFFFLSIYINLMFKVKLEMEKKVALIRLEIYPDEYMFYEWAYKNLCIK